MTKRAANTSVRQVVYGVTFGLLLCGLFYVGFVNERLKGNIPDIHRAVLLIGFIIGIYAASSYIGVKVAERLTQKKSTTRL